MKLGVFSRMGFGLLAVLWVFSLFACGADRSPTGAVSEAERPAAKRVVKNNPADKMADAATAAVIAADAPVVTTVEVEVTEAEVDESAATAVETGVVEETVTTSDVQTIEAISTESFTVTKLTDKLSISSFIDWTGGKLILNPGDLSDVDLGELRIEFKVPREALAEGECIEMGIGGSTAEDLIVDFGPDGLTFAETCWLKISLGPTLAALIGDQIDPWHEHDGVVDQVGIKVEYGEDGSIVVLIAVDGFSRYGLRSR